MSTTCRCPSCGFEDHGSLSCNTAASMRTPRPSAPGECGCGVVSHPISGREDSVKHDPPDLHARLLEADRALEMACTLICEGCEKGWPFDDGWHTEPVLIAGTPIRGSCPAFSIRDARAALARRTP
jgi:hypothetical protein